jgi:hypothetical protein
MKTDTSEKGLEALIVALRVPILPRNAILTLVASMSRSGDEV